MPKHVIVIGAGVIGLSVALHAARRGMRVTVVDHEEESHKGCSHGNAGMIVPSHFVPLAAPGMVSLGLRMMWKPASPFYVKPRVSGELVSWGYRFWRSSTQRQVDRAAPLLRDMHLASRSLYEGLAGETGNGIGLVRKGLLMLCKSPETLAEESHLATRAKGMGIEAEVLDGAQAARLEPALRASVAGAVFYPGDCHLSPGLLIATLKRLLAEERVEVRWRTGVRGLRTSGVRISALETSAGDLSADEFVLCAGSWSAGLAKGVGIRMPLQAGKGYSLTLGSPRALPSLCAILMEARVAVTPMGSTLRFGGTMELSGLDESINPARVRGIVDAVPSYLPGFTPGDFAGVEPWCGLRPCSPDGLPYIGRFARFPNLSAATGHAMMGLSLAPVTGKLMGEVLDDEPPSVAIGGLAPDRFA